MARSDRDSDVTRLPSVTGRNVLRALGRAGFVVIRIEGSHHMLRHPQRGGLVSVPVHAGDVVPPGTLRNLLRQAGLTVEEFIKLL